MFSVNILAILCLFVAVCNAAERVCVKRDCWCEDGGIEVPNTRARKRRYPNDCSLFSLTNCEKDPDSACDESGNYVELKVCGEEKCYCRHPVTGEKRWGTNKKSDKFTFDCDDAEYFRLNRTCAVPTIENGSVFLKESGEAAPGLINPGIQITYKCEDGYALRGARRNICRRATQQFVKPHPLCKQFPRV